MEAIKWKIILGEWVKKTELVDVSGSIEHLDINMFYSKFRDKIRSADPNLQDDLNTFLKERFPAYEILYGDDKNISSGDYTYIFSLMLYYSCVVRVDEFFQKSCEALDSKHQPVVVKFFGHLNQVSARLLTRDVIHTAIKQASPSPFHLKFITSSPRGTPEKIFPTPKKMSFDDKSKEYQRTKTQLENEKYERMMMECELKQNEDKLQQLMKEVKSLKQELQKLKQEQLMDKDNENLSPNKVIRDEQTRLRLKKEIDSRDEVIVSLKCDIDVLSSKEEKNKNRMLLMEREMKEIRQKINEADCIIEELGTELAGKNRHILMLEETNNELRSFIDENRSQVPEDVSSDALDVSLSTSITAANTSGNGENLAKCVIDVQLKEKEAENLHLKEMLAKLAYEKEVLENAMLSHEETTSVLQTQLNEKSSTIATLTNQTDNVMKENKSLIEKSKHLESGIHLSGQKIEEMNAMVKTQINECNKALQDAQKAREEFQILLESEKANCSILREKYEKETLESSGAIDSLTNDVSITMNDLKEKSSEVEALKAENQKLLEKGRNDIESLIAAKDATLINIESCSKAKIEDLKEASKKMKEGYRKKTQLLQEENEVVQKQVVEYRDLLKTRDEKLKQIEDEKSTLQSTIHNRDQEKELSFKTNQEKQSIMEKEIDALKQQFVIKSEELVKTLEDLRVSNAELSSIKSVQQTQDDLITKIQNENIELEKMLEDYKSQLNEVQTNFSTIQNHLELQVDTLKTELHEVNIKLEGLTTTLLQKEETIKKLTTEMELMKQEIQNLNNLIASLSLTTEKLTSDIHASEQAMAEMEDSLEDMKSLLSNSENNLKDKDIELSKLGKELEVSMLKQKSCEESSRAAESMVESLKSSKVSFEEKLEIAEAQNDTVQKRLQKTIEQLEIKLEQEKTSTEAQQTLSLQHKQEIFAMEKKLSDSENCKKDLINEVENLSTSLEKITFELREKKTLLSTLAIREEKQTLEQARLEGELSGLKQTISERELHIENIDLEMSLLAENKQSIIRSKAILENEMDALKSAVSTKTAEVEKLDSLNNEIKEKLSMYEKTVEVLRNEKEDLNERMNIERSKFTQLQNEMEDSEEMISGLQINIDELKAQNQLLQVQVETTAVEKGKNESIASELKKELAIIKNDLSLKISQCSHNQSEQKALQEIVSQSAELKTDYDQMQIQYNDLKEQAISLERAISSKDDEISQLTTHNNCLIISLDNITDVSKQNHDDHLKAIREYEEQNREQQVDLNTFQEKLQQSQAQIDELTSRIEKLDKNLQDKERAYKEEAANFTKTIKQQEVLITEKNEAISDLNKLKIENCEKIKTLELQVETTNQSTGDDVSRLKNLLAKLEKYKLLEPEMKELKDAHEREKQFNDKLSHENEVYNAKLIKTRQENDDLKNSIKDLQLNLTDIKKKADEEVRDTRLEMEGKLEKMKERMKLLYTEEMAKKNQKNEEKLEEIRQELQSRDEEIKRLKITSEAMRENELLKRKLKFLEINSGIQPRESIGMSRVPTTTNQMNGGNFGMEDEAGEEFNNTYLVGLQQAGSELSLNSNKPFSVSELQQRNSMYPQHMRGSYSLYNTDKNLGEQEMKDGANVLDDSRAALIQNGANRKKQSISYHKPGPPTPSKKAGRLSIGVASDVNYTNVLKDSTNTENVVKKTPRSFTRLFGSTKQDELNASHVRIAQKQSILQKLSKSSRNCNEQDDDDDATLPSGSSKEKEGQRKKDRDRARDNNRPNFVDSCSSPEYELLNCDDTWDSQDNDEKTVIYKPRRLNKSFEEVKHREDWMNQQQQARLNRFVKNRKVKPSISTPKNSITPEDFNQYISCSSMKSFEVFTTPKKGLVRNFIVSNHAEVDRISDIYVKRPPFVFNSKQELDNESAENISLENLRYFVMGFILACFYFSVIHYKRE